jgi:DNA-binding response OmpR family regulator
MRLLLVEDDKKAARVLARGLREEGFVVDVAHSGDVGGEMALATSYDLVVLDWMLPRKDGIRVCQDLRSRQVVTPILMLTARDSLGDRISGLDSGADDYLAKPFAFEELLARMRALLRRSELTRPVVLRTGQLALDPTTRRVTCAGVAVSLTPKEYAILEILMRHTGTVITRARIGDAVWHEAPEDLSNLVDVHVSHLRRKIESPRAGAAIETVRAQGFRIVSAGE